MNNRTYGYLHIVIRSPGGNDILSSNDERAFVIAKLQDSLSPRLLLLDIPDYQQLASCIDLLAFSVTRQSIHLLMFTVDISIAKRFIQQICIDIQNYQYMYHTQSTNLRQHTNVSFSLLSGPHQALSRSVDIHLLQPDWEFNRYSSIGFYLHDRRGDWMRFWRIANIYHNNPLLYRKLIDTQKKSLAFHVNKDDIYHRRNN